MKINYGRRNDHYTPGYSVYRMKYQVRTFKQNIWVFFQGIGKVKTYFLNGHRPGAKIPGKTGLPRGILKMK